MWRNILGVIVGLAFGNAGIMLLHKAAGYVYPFPEGMDQNNMDHIASYLETAPLGAFFMVIVAHLGGAILGGLENHACEAFASYGSHMGVAFQLIDDALDYSGDKDTIGKNLGDDFSQGKVTLPLIYVMKNGSDKQRKFLRDAIKSQSDLNLERVVEIMELTNAIEYVYGKANIEIQLAIDALQVISDSKYKKCLIDLAKFSIERRA